MNDDPLMDATTVKLIDRIKQIWGRMSPIRNEEIVEEGTLPGERKLAEKYFFGRPLSRVDPGDPLIRNEGWYYECFTPVAMRYYAGVFLVHLLMTYTSGAYKYQRSEDMSALHFRGFLASERAKRVPFDKEQASVIADVLEYISDKIEIERLSEGEIDELLESVRYWTARAKN